MSDLPTSETRAQTRWLPLAEARLAMSPAWQRWVGSRDSLTLRLTEAGAPRPFRVRLLDQRLDAPRPDEARALGIAPG